MASGTGLSAGNVSPVGAGLNFGSNTSILGSAYGGNYPSSMGGNTAAYESAASGPVAIKGGYIPDKTRSQMKKRRTYYRKTRKGGKAKKTRKAKKGGKKAARKCMY